MIQYRVNTGHAESTQLATLYDPWDISDDDKKYNWNSLTSLDIDKYILLDDGNNLYAKITYVSSIYVRTTAGVFRKKDIIHCSIPRYEFNGYSGASDTEESFEVRAATRNERAKANQLLAGKKFKSVSQRVKMLSMEVITERAKDRGFSNDFIADMLMDSITQKDKNGRKDGQWLNALKILAKMEGSDLDNPLEKDDNNLGSGFGAMITVQERKKLSNIANIEKAIILSDCRNEDVVNAYESDVVKIG